MVHQSLEPVVLFALRAVGSPYVYGATGKPCTPAYRKTLSLQYPLSAAMIRANCPVLSGRSQNCATCRCFQLNCYDCAQLTRRAFETVGVHLPSGASSQWAAPIWAEQGVICQKAFNQVCALFSEDRENTRRPMRHVGISLGDGRVVDARGHKFGVLLSRAGDYPWTHYGILKAEPTDQKPDESLTPPSLGFGSRGMAVEKMQRQLVQLGFPLPRFGADGIFGLETAAAVRAFQRSHALYTNGVFGLDEQRALSNQLQEVFG